MHTGDIASIDAQGGVEIKDRIKDVIKTGGEWISSLELENLISEHPVGHLGRGRGHSRRAMGRTAHGAGGV